MCKFTIRKSTLLNFIYVQKRGLVFIQINVLKLYVIYSFKSLEKCTLGKRYAKIAISVAIALVSG